MSNSSKTPLLDAAPTPDLLRKLKPEQLRQFADELRLETIETVSVTGGHFGAGLGVVELTLALHHVFDTPRDALDHITTPTLILTGEDDDDNGSAQELAAALSDARYQAIPGNHMSAVLKPELGMAIAAFLAA